MARQEPEEKRMTRPTRLLSGALALQFALAALAAAQTEKAPGEAAKPAPRALDDYSKYVLGPGDELTIWALGVPEISDKPLKVGPGGVLDLPIAGRLDVAGLTVENLRLALIQRLKAYVVEPAVSISISDFKSQPVSVLGAVRTPGVFQVQGRKTVMEMISMAGGFSPDAGRSIKIVRRLENGRLPVLNATDDATGGYSVAEVSLPRLMEGKNPEQNIPVLAHDVITVPMSQMVYVMGEVTKPGGYVLSEREALSVLQALSLAGGMTRTAAPKQAVILRASASSKDRQEIQIPLHKVLAGKAEDIAMRPEDILLIPNNVAKNISVKAIETAVQLGVGIAIWRH
jgi:polysaccharide biosynthesis/export protein